MIFKNTKNTIDRWHNSAPDPDGSSTLYSSQIRSNGFIFSSDILDWMYSPIRSNKAKKAMTETRK